jgi:hypothetical protein
MSAPIYINEGSCPVNDELNELNRVLGDLKQAMGDHALIDQALDAVGRIRSSASANVPISRGSRRVGFGIDKVQKAIACDQAISIIKQIKSLKAW